MEVDPSNIFITTIILRESSDIYDDFKFKNPFGNHELYKHSSAHDWLKGLAQAKIIKKSVILFRVLNMTIWCKHVHRLELQIFIIFVQRIHQLG